MFVTARAQAQPASTDEVVINNEHSLDRNPDACGQLRPCDGCPVRGARAQAIVMSSKGSRGIGIIHLKIQNKCILSKGLFNVLNEDGLWQSLIQNKYLGSKDVVTNWNQTVLFSLRRVC